MTDSSTLFLRLEGPLQSWGDTSKFVIRRSMEAPTKSGVIGLISCAMGWSRPKVVEDPIPDSNLRDRAQRLIKRHEKDEVEPRRALLDLLNMLTMGVRIDRPGMRWWDYHTVGAKIGMTTAAGGLKTDAQGTVIKRLEYLADASFLVALQGDADLVGKVAEALHSPKWPLYLGRKSCPPSVPVLITKRRDDNSREPLLESHATLESALSSPSVPWRPRYEDDLRDDERILRDGQPRDKWKIVLDILIEWRKSDAEPDAPDDADVWYDVPFSFDPPAHRPRLVKRDGKVTVNIGPALQHPTPPPPRPRANYKDAEWTSERLVEVVDPKTGKVTLEPYSARPRRLRRDQGLCVFCKSPATTVQHVTYRRAGGNEDQDDLRSLCRLCHDAVTMIEYGLGMGLDRINPEDPRWRDDILRTRCEILRWRSEETRRRALRSAPEKVRKEMLEEED